MIIYTRFNRPTMPAENARNVPAYVAPVARKVPRKESTPAEAIPVKPKELAVLPRA